MQSSVSLLRHSAAPLARQIRCAKGSQRIGVVSVYQQRTQQQQHSSSQAAATAAAGSLWLLAAPAALASTAASAAPTATSTLFELAALDSATAGALNGVLRPVLSALSLLMIARIVMSWYPELDGDSLPWAIAYKPTGGQNCAIVLQLATSQMQ